MVHDDNMSAGRKRRVEWVFVVQKDNVQDRKEYNEREYQDRSYTFNLEKLSLCTHDTDTASLPHSLMVHDDNMSAGRKRRVESAVVAEKDNVQDRKEYSEREYQDRSYAFIVEKLSVCTHDNEEVNPLSDDLGLNTASRPSNTSDEHEDDVTIFIMAPGPREASAIKRRTLSAETSRNCFHTLLTMPGAEVVKLTNSLRRGTPRFARSSIALVAQYSEIRN